jgi:uncharacterized protein (TIGR03083 family)
MKPPPPVQILDVLPEERERFLELLADLDDAAWRRPTGCPGWTVHDVALHLLGDDLGLLSRMRDGVTAFSPGPDEPIVPFINRLNAEWVISTRRLSPRVLLDLLRLAGEQTHAHFSSLDPFTLGETVSWAGPEPAPHWLGIAREYTERWVHQQQIREALAAPILAEPRLFAPVLATFVRALPHTFRDVAAPAGTTVSLRIEGDAGGEWSVARSSAGRWELFEGLPTGPPDALVKLDQDTAWRLFTKGIGGRVAERRASIEGHAPLGRNVLRTVAILA